MQMRVEKIRSYLLENMEDKELIERIEKAINERRKVQSYQFYKGAYCIYR